MRPGSWMDPDGRAAGDPLGDALVGEHVALPSWHRAEEGDPVPYLLAAVAPVPLDLLPREPGQRLDVAARHVIEHAQVELGIDALRLRRSYPVGDPARSHEGNALSARPAADEVTHEGSHLMAASGSGEGRRRAVRVHRHQGHLAIGHQAMKRPRQLVPALDVV